MGESYEIGAKARVSPLIHAHIFCRLAQEKRETLAPLAENQRGTKQLPPCALKFSQSDSASERLEAGIRTR